MLKKNIIKSIFFFSIGLFSQQKNTPETFSNMLENLISHTVKEVSPKQTKQMENVILLDAREKKEYKTSHLKNAIWVGYNNFKRKAVKKIDKNSTVVVYCSVGYRSEKIAEKLEKMGFTNVYNLYGGIFKWVNQQNPVYNSSEETLKVHAFDKEWGQWLLKGQKVY